jgi:hypothetical protein
MTKEEKVLERQSRSHRRKHKRYLKDQESLKKARDNDFTSISIGRRLVSGSYFMCEMGYSDCSSRGFCNGDC